MKSIKLIAMALCCPLLALCQDITGLWTGTIYNDSTRQHYQYEVGITKENGKYSGFSHTWFNIGEKKYFGVKKIKVRIATDGKVVIEDCELIRHNYPVAPNKDVRQLNVLHFETNGAANTLNGPFMTNRTRNFLPLTGTVSLKKNDNISQSDLVPHLKQLIKSPELSSGNGLKPSLVKNSK